MKRGNQSQHKDPSALTPREAECWELRGQGLTNQQIGDKMGIKRASVAVILTKARAKLLGR
jgi:DNA-binding CsgD family transcriptional regulator